MECSDIRYNMFLGFLQRLCQKMEKILLYDKLEENDIVRFHFRYLADMQAYLDKRHRQQNKEILIRHSPGIGECFVVFKYSISKRKILLRYS